MRAQGITKGSIAGVFRDVSGAVVPDALVTLVSPYGEHKTVTNAFGAYTFANLVTGSGYVLTAQARGFNTEKVANLSVYVNAQTTQDISLPIGETVTAVEVIASGTSLDLSSTMVAATLQDSLFTNVPVGRNISSLIALAPGVADSGGAGAANPSISGASGLENTYYINGMDVTDPGYGGFGTFSRYFGSLGTAVNFDFIQEVQVQTGGFEARYGQALGGIVNALTKSGSNSFHGSLFSYFQPPEFESTRPDPNQLLTNKVTYVQRAGRYDFGGDAGGYLIKDKLFWSAEINPGFDHSYQSAAQKCSATTSWALSTSAAAS
jgi:hypothetical protein